MALWVLIVGIVMLIAALPLAGLRVAFLYRLISSGQPAPERIAGVTGRVGTAIKDQLVEVLGQRRLFKWSVPGAAHAMVFWAFLILGTVYLEAFGILFSRNPAWHIWLVGRWDVLGFAQDLIGLLCLVGIVMFAQIRLKNDPHKLGRKSRFNGSHLGGAWLILFMIFNVLWTLFFFRGVGAAEGNLPYGNGAFVSHNLGKLFDALPDGALSVLEGVGLLLHIGVMLVFLIIVLNSKHLHIFVAPLNVAFKRHPLALGAVKPLTNDGKAVTLDDMDDLDEDATLGIGSIEDFSWKGMLDFASCTECGRCQSQCPAWNTEKPLSPKMLIMNLRDHAFAKAPYLLADESQRANLPADVLTEAERPLVGETEGLAWEPTGGAIIDTDVLWSCVTCGACVEQCPVDIEHVDHIVDMRRYQVLVEANFPAELNQLFKGMESKGNPWNMSPTMRMDWAKGLDFEVKVVGEDIESLDEVDWLFWVGCAGAYEDRQKKTTRAVAELLDMAGVSFGVLGNGETCTGDQARRAGNEFVFQGLAQQNVETFKEFKVKKVVSTCAHCFNTLKNEYKEFGVELEVVHHTQLLNRLVREGKLTPVNQGDGAHSRKITYHDPCYIGRHNGVYTPPRELLQVLPGAEFVEMERNSEKSFCCGAGGARMWMEENIGERINVNRTNEAIGTGADQIAVGCPFCRVMLSDGLTSAIDKGEAREEVEVLDVAQMLLASVKGEMATKLAPGAGAQAKAAPSPVVAAGEEETAESGAASEAPQVTDTRVAEGEAPAGEKAEPEAKSSAAASSGSSLFDSPAEATEEPAKPAAKSSGSSLFDTPAEGTEEPAKPAAKSSGSSLFDTPADAAAEEAPTPAAKASSGGSLFDLGGDSEPAAPAAKAEAEPEPEPQAEAAPKADLGTGGSLFDLEPAPAAEPAAKAEFTPEPEPTPEPAPEPEAKQETAKPAADLSSGGSLFDLEAPAEPTPKPAAEAAPEPTPEPEAKAEPEPQTEPQTEAEPAKPVADLSSGGSLFDIAAPEVAATPAPATKAKPESTPEPEPEAEPEAPVSSSHGPLFDVAAPEAHEAPESAPEPEADPEPEPEADPGPEAEATEPEPAEEPKPAASNGAANTPKTDVDISGSSSLFDI